MTCIVGVSNGESLIIAGDSLGVRGLDVVERKDAKVFSTGPFLIGFTTSFRMGQLLQYKLDVPLQSEGEGDHEYMCTKFIDSVQKLFREAKYGEVKNDEVSGGEFLIGYKGILYHVYPDFQVAVPSQEFSAAGCGSDFAMGSLFETSHLNPSYRARKAIHCAAHFSGGVGGAIVSRIQHRYLTEDKKDDSPATNPEHILP